MKVPSAVLEQAAKVAHRRAFEGAPEITRPYRESDWTATADEATRQHFRDLVSEPVQAALDQYNKELLGEGAVEAAALFFRGALLSNIERSDDEAVTAIIETVVNHVLEEGKGGGDGE